MEILLLKPDDNKLCFETRRLWLALGYSIISLYNCSGPLEGGGTICSNVFFCSDNFRLSIYSS